MQESPKTSRYNRPILPGWFPDWLAICLVLGVICAIAGWFVLEDDQRNVLNLLGTFGFGFACGAIILTLAHAKVQRNQRGTPLPRASFFPPVWIEVSVFAALVVALGYSAVAARQLGGWKQTPPLLTGAVAVIVGFFLIVGTGVASAALALHRPAQLGNAIAGTIGLLISVAGCVLALIRVLGESAAK